MKNLTDSLKQKLTSKYTVSDTPQTTPRSTNINVLLNRVRLDQKRTLKKRIVFSIILAGLVSSLAIYFII